MYSFSGWYWPGGHATQVRMDGGGSEVSLKVPEYLYPALQLSTDRLHMTPWSALSVWSMHAPVKGVTVHGFASEHVWCDDVSYAAGPLLAGSSWS